MLVSPAGGRESRHGQRRRALGRGDRTPPAAVLVGGPPAVVMGSSEHPEQINAVAGMGVADAPW